MLFNLFKLFFIVILFSSCKENKAIGKLENSIIVPQLSKKEKVDSLKIVLEAQLDIGYSQLYDDSYDISDYKYSQRDLAVIVPFLNTNVKEVSKDVFKNKIRRIFGRTILPKSKKRYLTIIINDPCNRSVSYYRNDNSIDIRPISLHIIKDHNFITELYAVPEIINYKEQFPYLFEKENATNNSRVSSDGSLVKIYKWKDIENLDSKREFNLKKFVSRNEYLFADIKTHFNWLVNNDELFMKSLISEFGYLDDDNLINWYIKKYRLVTVNGRSNGLEYGKMLWHKDCNKKFIFHDAVLNKMKGQTTYCDDLKDYVYFLIENNKDFDNISFQNQAYLIAKIYHFIQNETQDTFQYLGFFAEYYDKDNIYSNEFLKNNYYGLEDFKSQWLKAKKVGNGISH